MQNQQSLPSMIFIKFALHEVGENCLISKYKANHFFHVSDLGPQEFIRLFTIVQGIPNPQDPKLILPGDNAFPSDKGKNSYCISKYNLLLVIISRIAMIKGEDSKGKRIITLLVGFIMILSVTIDNFKGIKNQIKLSCIASNKIKRKR